MEGVIEDLKAFAVEYGMDVIGGILILVIGWIIAIWAKKLVHKWGDGSKIDDTLVNFMARAVRIAILIFVVIAVLSKFGIETASIIGVLAAASLAIGLALQGTLSNFAAGIMLLIFRPFQIGDYVEIAGETGTVVDLGIFATEMKPPSGEFTLIPNAKIWGEVITNYSRNSIRRMRLDIGIDYADDHKKAREVALRVARATGNVLEDPEPHVEMTAHGDSAIVMTLFAWTETASYWPTVWETTESIKEAFDAEGLSFPFPQRDVHVFKESA